MFTNIGGKLKTLAKVAAWLGIIASVISGIGMMTMRGYNYGYGYGGGLAIVAGLVVIIVGSLAAWLSALALYGFGELIEKTTEIADNTRKPA